MQKKILIGSIILFILVMILLMVFDWFNLFWATVFVLPILFIVDLCYALLPVTIPVLFGLSIYSIVKKDYQKFNSAYEFLLISIMCGIFNFIIDTLLNNVNYVELTHCYRVYWLILLLALIIMSIINIRKFKDNRIYLWTYTPMILFYLLFEIIKAAE